MTEPTFRIGFLLFPGMTQLDMTGPYEVLSRLPGSAIHLVWKEAGPVASDRGLAIVATDSFVTCPPLDLICVPGGPGINELLTDAPVLDFIRHQAWGARYITSVCTGALVLGAAGLLYGKRATTHWMSHDLLAAFGAVPVKARVVTDGRLITGGGVTAGIDFALTILAELGGRELAQAVELGLEYDPQPPFGTGSPERAGPELEARMRALSDRIQGLRAEQVRRAAAALAPA
ncbi:glutamine amidotransferase [Aliidongia dinghuensis]|uniref:Glutamine amidotransferase n=1 Tax=Aliidongia dinghuensis TaxID=1867774 RepID=A0A8J2YW89_9PROT|nr:DJ-1/PfpI family protein [Aliidongia dinghuensis]GGF27051.1 glutamine amidotransferase [Aliidongia dinghuensis]